MDIARKPQQVSVILYDNALISTLEQMTTSIMSPVEALGVGGAEPLHCLLYQLSPLTFHAKLIRKIKNPTSQVESGVLFQENHVDPPLKV